MSNSELSRRRQTNWIGCETVDISVRGSLVGAFVIKVGGDVADDRERSLALANEIARGFATAVRALCSCTAAGHK